MVARSILSLNMIMVVSLVFPRCGTIVCLSYSRGPVGTRYPELLLLLLLLMEEEEEGEVKSVCSKDEVRGKDRNTVR